MLLPILQECRPDEIVIFSLKTLNEAILRAYKITRVFLEATVEDKKLSDRIDLPQN